MKTTRFIAIVAVAAALVACKKDDDPKKEDYKISASPSTVVLESEGGSVKVAVSTNADSFEVTGAADWLDVSVSGKEVTLSAEANIVKEVRSCTLTISAESVSCKVEVSQKAGSPYVGYKLAESCTFEYGGTALYAFMKPVAENYGGQAYLNIVTEDDAFVVEFFTDLFMSEDEVVLPVGKYTAGEDDYSTLTLQGVPMTFVPGLNCNLGDDDDPEYTCMGSYFTNIASETQTCIVDGMMEISGEGSDFVIKCDFKDADGKEHKIVFEGEPVFDLSGAAYPSGSDHPDPTQNILFGDYSISDSQPSPETCLTVDVSVYFGDPEDPMGINWSINLPLDADLSDISGEYFTDEENPYAPGTCNFGELVELFPGFSMPVGSYIIYAFGDYDIVDQMASLILEKQEDGKYVLSGSMMGSAGFMHFFFDPTPIEFEYISYDDYED